MLEEKTLKTSQGLIRTVVVSDNVQVKKYDGKFRRLDLQDKADTGLWYTIVVGNGSAVVGEGSTVPLALQDAINRNQEQARNYQGAAIALTRALGMYYSEQA